MCPIKKYISGPLFVALVGAAVGALSGEFAWTLLAGFGLWAFVSIAQNLFAFIRSTHAGASIPVSDADDAPFLSTQDRPNWLEKWIDDMDNCPTYKGTAGNIWNDPKWATRK